MAGSNPAVEKFFNDAPKWRDEMLALRAIVREFPLEEAFKWRQPCYTVNNGNVVIISGFKEYCALNLFKGALLHDPSGILVSPGENTQYGRQIRFTSVEQIVEMEPILKAYLDEAIENEKAGLQVEQKQTEDYPVPDELQSMLDELPDFKAAFEALTPGRQRGYLLHFAAAKQSKTRTARIEKHMQRIKQGKGLLDR
jgi:uncharacterized protein YdeI (YjbR/CyaY-like superfamily)